VLAIAAQKFVELVALKMERRGVVKNFLEQKAAPRFKKFGGSGAERQFVRQ